MSARSVLVLGAEGQVGREFPRLLAQRKWPCVALGRQACDLTDTEQLRAAVDGAAPDLVINCAAYNEVDQAEREPERARRVNGLAVRELAMLCKARGAVLVHYSTDYVFDGKKGDYYTEDDTPNPLSAYAKSKLDGEWALRDSGCAQLLLRVSWVIGMGQRSFLQKFTQWTQAAKSVKIGADETSVPTSAEDIAALTLDAVDHELRGLYHLTNSGYASRYELARYFAQRMGFENVIIPVASASFGLPAARPLFSPMSHARLAQALGCSMKPWQDGVDRLVARLKAR